MKYALKLLLALALSLSFVSSTFGQQAVFDTDRLATASRGLFVWFNKLKDAAKSLVPDLEREQLRTKLTRFSRQLTAIENDKMLLLAYLNREPPNVAQARLQSDKVAKQIDEARKSLDDIVYSVRESFRAEGRQVAYELQMSMTGRKSWVREVVTDDPATFPTVRRKQVVAEGDKALIALRRANEALVTLISSL